MRTINFRNFFLLLSLIFVFSCRQPYVPPIAKANLGYLVVDGTIIGGEDSTIINLSRTQNINDSISFVNNPETGAMVSVVGANGDLYNLLEQNPGQYVSDQLPLNTNELYRLKIVTSNGNQYLSDSMQVIISPPIDSVSGQLQNDGMHVTVTTHDPLNNTRYYRWNYTETWEYNSAYESAFIYDPYSNMVFARDVNNYIFTCWRSDQSTSLLLGSSAKLSQDLIYEQPLILIPLGSQKLAIEYSILVKQYALDASAYNFWQILQNNTEQLGSLFDAQPSELTGNVHNIANVNEPVLGYVSVSTIQQQRVFIPSPASWVYPPLQGCSKIEVPNIPDSFAFYFRNSYIPISADVDQATGAVIGYFSSYSTCVDCTEQGGTTVKPPFWP
ncbi:MAG TPA: DUF4249 domain-containing protein [Puia sp.]|nr:DUF4249 domain-containing protein [Puia sp.]